MAIRHLRESEALDRTFAALAHPTRRAIIERLAKDAATVNQLAEPFDMTLPAISHHIRILQRAGLIEKGRAAQYRPCVLQPGGLAVASIWTDRMKETWNAQFTKMDAVLASMKEPNDEQ